MGLVNSCIVMEMFIQGSGLMIKQRGLESTHIGMDRFMRGNGGAISRMGRGGKCGPMALFIMDSLLRGGRRGEGSWSFLMGPSMLESLSRILLMGLVSIIGLLERFIKGNGGKIG